MYIDLVLTQVYVLYVQGVLYTYTSCRLHTPSGVSVSSGLDSKITCSWEDHKSVECEILHRLSTIY